MNAAPLPLRHSLASLLLLLLLSACSTAPQPRTFPDASALPAQAAMPDPLVMLNGERVTSRAQWFHERRPELQALFQHYEYGCLPSVLPVQAKLLGQYSDFLNGQATLKLVSLEVGPFPPPSTHGSRPFSPLRIDLMLVVPNHRSAPAPVFLAMDFWGNQALTADPRVPLPGSWLPASVPGCVHNAATEASRGAQATNWPLAEIVRRGYALATFYSGDIDPDRKEASIGLYALLAGTNAAANPPANRGTIAAWAWGFHRCVDYLVRDPDLDPKRIATVGHSRNGKACLLAAAFDDRIAIAFPHQAGTGGSAPSRGNKTSESVKAINDSFPHWFNAEFKQFNHAPERLPFDQNGLVALCAPRPVLFTAAQEDQWANPAGQFEVLRAADPVYRLVGSEGLGAKEMPPLRQLVASPLGYYIREGKHSMSPADWRVFMDFADKQFGRK